MSHKSFAQIVFSLLMVLLFVIEPVAPALSSTSALPSELPLTGEKNPATLPGESNGFNPLRLRAERLVTAQQNRPEPTPVAIGTPLPPGTVKAIPDLVQAEATLVETPVFAPIHTIQAATNFHYRVYLPLLFRDYVAPLEDLALHPDIWMEATQDWPIEELPRLQGSDPVIIIRRPPSWDIDSRTNGLRFSEIANQIVVNVEYAEALKSFASVIPHPDTIYYQQKGYQVTTALFKGLSAWQISPVDSDGDFCRKVIVALPNTWVHFQLSNGGLQKQSCASTYEFDLLLSSLQMRVEEETADEESLPEIEYVPDFGIEMGNQIQWISYNRQSAYNYAAQYWSSCTNSDGYCAPGGDGMHFVSHALCNGGFPIHWCANPQQGHSDARVINTVAHRNYMKGFSDVYSTSAGNMRVGDVVYIGKGTTCWGWGGIVTSIQGGLPYVTTHSNSHWNKRYDVFYGSCGTPASYDLVHIDASDDYPLPYVNSGVALDPAVQSQNANVRATFYVHNYGGQGATINFKVVTPIGDFGETGYFYLPAGSGYFYESSRSFANSGDFSACAQMNTGGGWQYIPATGGGATCSSFHIRYPADPRINSGLNLYPNPQVVNEAIATSFYVHNYGEEGINVRFRVTTNGAGEFAETGYVYINPGNGYTYNQSRAFGASGTYYTCAQMDTGWGWQNIPQTGGGVTCQYLNIIPHGTTDVRLNSHLQVTPEQLEPGGTVYAAFTARNTSSLGLTENFRARVFNSTDFPESGTRLVAAGETYSYNASRVFDIPGIYQVTAEHYAGGAWVALWGDGVWVGSRHVRVIAPPPSPPAQNKGTPPTCGYAGEPVNTSTGNYFYDFTDLSDPTPGLTLAATRWYNALDAHAVNGPFGFGTSWLYSMAATFRNDKSALVQMADGHLAYFLGDVNPDDPFNLDGVYQGQGLDAGSTLTRNGNMATLTTPDQTSYHFDAAGRLVRVTHPYPAEIALVYSGSLPVQLVHSSGVAYTLTYSGSLITNITSSNGRAVTYTYSTAGDLIQVTRSDGSFYTYEYDMNHRLTEARDPNGHAFVRNVYDTQGRVIRQYDQSGQESVFTYGAQITGPRVYTDALGNTSTHVYDANYYLTREIDALGYTTVYTRNAAGLVLERQDKDGAVWRYTYDTRGNQLTETNPLGQTWIYTYDARNNRTSQTDPTKRTWLYEYDNQNRLTRTVDPVGHAHDYSYDAEGHLLWERNEASAQTWYAYNELGLRTVITDSLGYVTRMGYDAWGNQTVYTDANGSVAYFFYDALNRLERSIDPAGTVITFTYDAMGNLLTESNGLGQVRTYTYDAHDRIIAETDFNGNTTRYGYDALGHRTVITDALGHTTVYTYNAVGNLAAQRGKDGAVTRYEYDRAGRLVREIDPLGRVTEYVYDAAGRQIETRRPCATCAGGVAISRTFYDAAGQVVEERDARGAVTRYAHDAIGRVSIITDTYGYTRTTTYNPIGLVIQETAPLGAITRYDYNLLGQLITTTNALGYQTVNVYDAVGRVTAIVNERGYITTYVYDANDRVVEMIDAQGNRTRNTYDAAGRLIAFTDALGRTTTYTYDANGNRLTETNPRGHTTTYVYDALNRVVEVIEPAGCCGSGIRLTTYDDAGRIIAETNALGFTRVITYNIAGQRIAERSPLGYTTVYTYDVANNLTARREPNGALWQFAYDANGNQTRQIDPLGNTSSVEYDLLNRAVREVNPLGAITTRQYDGAGRVVTQRDPRGATTRYTYDLLGRVTQEIDPFGYTRVFTYDGAGNRIAAQDARGFVAMYVYDALNREIAQTDPLGHSRYTLYDAAGQTQAVVDYKGYTTCYKYDAAGNSIQVTDALSYTTSTEYDALNRPIAVTDALSRTTRTGYDILGQVISQTTALGYTTVYTYNVEGWQTARRDALGGVWLTEYDVAGRPVRETDPLGRVKTTTYDALGRLIAKTDALGRATTLTYDPFGRLTAISGPDGTAQHYTYDAVGNILTEQDGNEHTTRYEYDLNGRLIRKTDALGRSWRYRYDPAGNVLETLTPSGRRVLQVYDALGRLITTAYDGAQVLALTYDANGNRATMTDILGVTLYSYDALNRLIGSSDPAGRVVSETYDAAGQRTSLTYPDGTTACYAYDADGRLSAVTAPDGQTTTYTYDALGRPTRVTQGNGVSVETTYDAVGNTLSILQRAAGGAVFVQHTYTVDAADRRAQVIEKRGGQTLTLTYTYDDLDRLIASLASDGRATRYAFDGAGNRTTMWGTRLVGSVTEAYTVTYTYNATNQLLRAMDSVRGLTTYTYDADGNRTAERAPGRWSDYTYDAGGRMTEARVRLGQVGNLTYKDGVYQQYIYDGLGRRARVTTRLASDDSLATQRDYRYNDGAGGWDVLQTYDAQGESYGKYLYDQSLHRLAYWQGGAMGYLQHDGLGSVLGATAADGAAPAALMRYGDYGEELGPDEALPIEDGYTGYERDTYTGLNYARHRYYDAATGTFLTVDPYYIDRQDIFDLHRYLYVQANPINNVDTLGLFLTGIISKIQNTKKMLPQSYTVKSGDTLSKIASQHNTTVDIILRWNPSIKDRNKISIGQRILIPGLFGGATSAKNEQTRTNNQATEVGTSGTKCGQPPQGMPTKATVTVHGIDTDGDFGASRDGGTRLHEGIDMYTPDKSKPAVYSTMNGKVIKIETTKTSTDSGRGNYVYIENNYYRTRYQHLDSVNVNEGDWVTVGKQVGTMGDTGSGGVHLHYEVEVWDGNKFVIVDPRPWLETDHTLTWQTPRFEVGSYVDTKGKTHILYTTTNPNP